MTIEMSQELPKGFELQKRYRIERTIAVGGWSRIYYASDLSLGDAGRVVKELVIEQLPPHERPQALAQLEREVEFLTGLNHRCLPHIYDHFVENERHYIVRDYIEGETLDERLKKNGAPLPEDELREYAFQIIDVLEYLHRGAGGNPIIIRDIKPDNLILDSQGKLMIMDLGIARKFVLGRGHDTLMMGTPGFAAPEQYGAAQSDERSDIYAFGATMHYLLSFRDPANTPFSFPSLRSLNPSVSVPFEALVSRCVALSPEARFQNVTELREVLSGVKSIDDIHDTVPRIATDLREIELKDLPGSGDRTAQLRVYNAGGGTLEAAVKSGAPWLDVTPGRVSKNEEQITLTVNLAMLPVGKVSEGAVIITSEREIKTIPVRAMPVPTWEQRLPDWAVVSAFFVIPILIASVNVLLYFSFNETSSLGLTTFYQLLDLSTITTMIIPALLYLQMVRFFRALPERQQRELSLMGHLSFFLYALFLLVFWPLVFNSAINRIFQLNTTALSGLYFAVVKSVFPFVLTLIYTSLCTSEQKRYGLFLVGLFMISLFPAFLLKIDCRDAQGYIVFFNYAGVYFLPVLFLILHIVAAQRRSVLQKHLPFIKGGILVFLFYDLLSRGGLDFFLGRNSENLQLYDYTESVSHTFQALNHFLPRGLSHYSFLSIDNYNSRLLIVLVLAAAAFLIAIFWRGSFFKESKQSHGRDISSSSEAGCK
ncbi:MAG: serine/threonine protein kinase [Vulcanimicrobiota bacterium]